MTQLKLTPEDLLAGAKTTYEISVPSGILRPGEKSTADSESMEMTVEIRPITIGTFQLIMKAAKSDPGLIPLLMIKESMVNPKLALPQIQQLHLGLIDFLIEHIREISGMEKKNT